MKAIIFDFDGTIADTLPVCFYAFQSVFKKYDDREVCIDEIKDMFGPSETGIIKKNLIHKDFKEAIELYYDEYNKKHSELVPINEEIDILLHCFKKKGFKLGIVTGKARRSLDISLRFLKMEGLFDVIITGDDVEFPKPHPEGVNKALSQLVVKNSNAIFLGESDADIKAGQDANVYTIGVQWLPNYQTVEFKIQPDKIFYKIDDLMHSYLITK
ncbi:HAD family hydrolase [Fictibacillus phosphorivorans]|uniref:HAD family hydrolase n=1 Tax=Fictibacillus phosphorivorans TaxID=1221500 RepID=UPI002AD573D2|nr:HAD family hydrolase [Fictibacillus phosphorivorans]